MSQSGAQAAAFFRDVAPHRTVWTVQDENGCPAPMTSSGRRSMPFWSSLSRVEKIIRTAPAYAAMEPREIDVDDWMREWLPGLKRDGLLIGINWSGGERWAGTSRWITSSPGSKPHRELQPFKIKQVGGVPRASPASAVPYACNDLGHRGGRDAAPLQVGGQLSAGTATSCKTAAGFAA
ncbi:DUF2750 domain-containing protein [Nonomuraea sp. MTCD27]|uniref:DUF2750 domain-containing protein n=1 Tax=Nonomuraea sp. MTCD27 TaxID=1676747 RepID=UPI0035C09A97